MAHAGGRPTEYEGDVTCAKAEEYLLSCVDEEYTRIKSEGDKTVSYDNLLRVKLPSIAGLAIYLDIGRPTVYEWKAKYPEFSYIVEKILTKQEEKLLEGGTSGLYNASISKVILTKHGYADRQEMSGPDGGAIEIKDNNPGITKLVKEYEDKLKTQLGL